MELRINPERIKLLKEADEFFSLHNHPIAIRSQGLWHCLFCSKDYKLESRLINHYLKHVERGEKNGTKNKS